MAANFSRVEAVRLAGRRHPRPGALSLRRRGRPGFAIDGSDRAAIVASFRRRQQADPVGPVVDHLPRDDDHLRPLRADQRHLAELPGSSTRCRPPPTSAASTPGDWSACSPPKSYSGLYDGPHSFAVRSVDVEDDTDPDPGEPLLHGGHLPPDGNASGQKEQKQKGKTIVVRAKVKAGEDLDVKASGKVSWRSPPPSSSRSPPRARLGQLEEPEAEAEEDESKDAKKISTALKQGKKATAKLEVNLTDEAGNTKTKKLSVKLKR